MDKSVTRIVTETIHSHLKGSSQKALVTWARAFFYLYIVFNEVTGVDKFLFVVVENLLVGFGHLVFDDFRDVVVDFPQGAASIGLFLACTTVAVNDVTIFEIFANEVIGMPWIQSDQEFGAALVAGAAEVDVFEVFGLERELAVHNVEDTVFTVGGDTGSQDELAPLVTGKVQGLGCGFYHTMFNLLEP